MSTPTAILVLVMVVAADVWQIGHPRYRHRVTLVMTVAALGALVDQAGLHGWLAGHPVYRLELLTTTAARRIDQVTTTVATLVNALVIVGATGALVPSFWARRIGSWARLTLDPTRAAGRRSAGADVPGLVAATPWRVWGLAVALVLLRPLSWGIVGAAADGIVAVLSWAVGEWWGGTAADASSAPAAWIMLGLFAGYLGVRAGWRPWLILPAYGNPDREDRHGTDTGTDTDTVTDTDGGDLRFRVSAPTGHGGGGGEPREIEQGVYVDSDYRGATYRVQRVRARYSPRPWWERMFGAPPAVAVAPEHIPTATPPPDEVWWSWLIDSVRAGARSVDIIREARPRWGSTPRTWERRIAAARRHLKELEA